MIPENVETTTKSKETIKPDQMYVKNQALPVDWFVNPNLASKNKAELEEYGHRQLLWRNSAEKKH